MKKDVQQERQWAVERFYLGERPHAICVSLDHSRSWLYKGINRAASDDPLWYQDQSRRPLKPGQCTPAEIEELVKLVRLSLYNNDLFCGAQAIQWELNDRGVLHMPSLRTINRILARQGLTNRRTGRYQPKGRAYPVLRAEHPNQIHHADFVGPCYLKGPIRFYSLNMVDLCMFFRLCVRAPRTRICPLPAGGSGRLSCGLAGRATSFGGVGRAVMSGSKGKPANIRA